tara:strand:+ start:612 stop:1043 length:432 start_codon:yes stop_codon:yes gene_type:complete
MNNYTMQASYDCHADWKLAEGVTLPKPLEDATEVWMKWNNLYVIWEGNLPMEFELTEQGDVEVDSKRPSDLMVWLGDYNLDNIVYDDTKSSFDEGLYKLKISKMKLLLTDLCEQVNDDISPANRTKHLKSALSDAITFLEGEQ